MLHRKAYKRLLYTLQINTVAAVVAAAALAQAQPVVIDTSFVDLVERLVGRPSSSAS